MNSNSSTIQPSEHENQSKYSFDRISELPESILHHILSFLFIKEVTRTSVLSKRWRFLWTWVPDLDLCQYRLTGGVMSFDQIIFNIFLSRRALYVRKLSLSCDFDCDRVNVFSILRDIVQRKDIEEFSFFFETRSCGEPFEMPRRLFCCKSLVVLKLDFVSMLTCFSVDLSNLKVLELGYVKYKDEDAFRNLLSSCPVLDKLVLGFAAISDPDDNGFHYEIASLTVSRIVVQTANPEAVLLSTVTIRAPALQYFAIDYCFDPCVLFLNNLFNFGNLKCKVANLLRRDYWGIVRAVFEGVCNVRSLELEFDSYDLISAHNAPTDICPRFDNLVKLKLVSSFCVLPLLLNMLLNCPRLEHLTLYRTEPSVSVCEEPDCWIPPPNVPYCLAFYLITVRFEGFRALKGEMKFIRYVLINSNVLKNMTITYRPKRELKKMFGAFEKISEFPRKARRCQLAFEEAYIRNYNLSD